MKISKRKTAMKTTIPLVLAALLPAAMMLQACEKRSHSDAEPSAQSTQHGDHAEGAGHGEHAVWLTSPKRQDTTITQAYVCRIKSCRHIAIRALAGGYLQPISVKEGQRVRAGEPLFEIMPTLYQARLEAERAEAQAARIEYENTKKLVADNVVSSQELAIAEAKLNRADARARLAEAELNFASIRAPFDGIIDRLEEQQGSLVDEGDTLTTLSDNSMMWTYFNVPEARYLEYVSEESRLGEGHAIELELANGRKFPHRGSIGAIEADFDNETGNIAFRADFPNPDFLLRNGQTGKVLIHHTVRDALLIPQRATFSLLAKRYVYVVDAEGIVRQREIGIDQELEDVFIVKTGLAESDRIVLEGIAEVQDGQRLEHFEVLPADKALLNQKVYAE